MIAPMIAVFPTLLWLLLTAAPLAAQDCRDEYPAPIPNSRFIVNQDGSVYQKYLGPNTAGIAQAMTRFDPDASWTALPAP